MKTILPKDVHPRELYAYLTAGIAPRPIALAVTKDENGILNAAPFSYFNVFAANPPTVVFSPGWKRDGTPKDTLANAQKNGEVAISLVNYAMAAQMSITSADFEYGISEIEKAGFTTCASQLIEPPYIAESPINLECKVQQIIPIGSGTGSGNLVICTILAVHIKEEVLDENGQISPYKIDLIARLGGDFYSRLLPETLFEIPRPVANCIGYNQLPYSLLNSEILTANDLGKLASVAISVEKEQYFAPEKQQKAKQLLAQNQIDDAWKILMSHEL